MSTARLLPGLVAVGAIALMACSSASATTTDQQAAVSANWSGYSVGGSTATGSGAQFSRVAASWVQPAANCSAGQGDAAFWVGLGGAGQQPQALEQAGTEADCSGGQPVYFAWYELLPAAPVHLDLAISPGDHISSAVNVSGNQVTIAVTDQTTNQSTTKTLPMDNPDVSSAEWIAEAPSSCDGSGNCQPLPLADFANVTFTSASATANGHTGPISDPQWTAQPMQLSGSSSGAGYDQGVAAEQPSAGAAPSPLTTSGASFSVSWQSNGGQASASGSTDPGAGAAGGAATGGSGPGSDLGAGGQGSGYGGYGYGYGSQGYGASGLGGGTDPGGYGGSGGGYGLGGSAYGYGG